MMNVADEMEWYCCGLILLHYLQDRVIITQINSIGGGIGVWLYLAEGRGAGVRTFLA